MFRRWLWGSRFVRLELYQLVMSAELAIGSLKLFGSKLKRRREEMVSSEALVVLRSGGTTVTARFLRRLSSGSIESRQRRHVSS